MRLESLYRNCTQKARHYTFCGTRLPSGCPKWHVEALSLLRSPIDKRPLRGLTLSSMDRIQPSSDQTWVFTMIQSWNTFSQKRHTHIQTLCTFALTNSSPALQESLCTPDCPGLQGRRTVLTQTPWPFTCTHNVPVSVWNSEQWERLLLLLLLHGGLKPQMSIHHTCPPHSWNSSSEQPFGFLYVHLFPPW